MIALKAEVQKTLDAFVVSGDGAGFRRWCWLPAMVLLFEQRIQQKLLSRFLNGVLTLLRRKAKKKTRHRGVIQSKKQLDHLFIYRSEKPRKIGISSKRDFQQQIDRDAIS